MTYQSARTGNSCAEHHTDLPDGTAGVYDLIADVARWPVIFPPCVHTEILASGAGWDRVRLWAMTGEKVSSWVSRRQIDAAAQRIDFEQEISPPPFARVGGHWRIDGQEGKSRLVLAHHWALQNPAPEAEAWVTDALDRNSTAEIAAVRRWAMPGTPHDDLIFDFTENLSISAPSERVYEFLCRADRWPEFLPHVARVDMETTAASPATGGAQTQTMQMVTRDPAGTTHTTRSVRLCFPGERIVYKQTMMPAPLLGHAGQWRLTAEPSGVSVAARHTVALDAEALRAGRGLLGPVTSHAEARAKVRAALARNTLTTLRYAGEHAG